MLLCLRKFCGLKEDAASDGCAAGCFSAKFGFFLPVRQSAFAHKLVSFCFDRATIFCKAAFIRSWHPRLVQIFLNLFSSSSESSVTRSSVLSPSGSPQSATYKPTLGPSYRASLPPKYRGFALSPRRTPLKHHRRKRNALPPASFAPSHDQGCEQITCSDPLTSTPIGSPCGCVYPMQVELDLGVAPFAVFPLVPELEIEIAAGTYLKQSQVRIMGATANSLDQGKTTVNIDLVPLGEKFDSTTARLTYERFWLKKVPINMTLFGDYSVVYVRYPGLPSSPPYVGSMGIGPSGGGGSVPGNHERPFMANVINKGQKMNARTVVLISFSSFVLFLMCVGVLCTLLKFKRLGRPASTVGPAVTSSITKRSGIKSILSSSVASSMPLSLTSTMATCILSVKTFTLAELGKATDKFSSDRILGEGGFGRVYHGIMEDGSEAAVKLLRRDDQSGDREFIVEVEMLSRLHHRNLVELVGICIEDHTRCLVYEVVRNGSVESHLHGSFLPIVTSFILDSWYVAPEYAMTGHLLVKSDVYSYGVVLLELLSGRKPVDMSQPQGQENLVTWARPLLTTREGLEQLVDPSLCGNYNFDNMAKVAAIALMCVHPEVTQRPFMGEVVQALKLVYNDMDETCGDSCSQKEESFDPDCGFGGTSAQTAVGGMGVPHV
ncbi:receptor-like serine/threonine-protein kinase ALE2 isoform X2 [Cinnamomum micranthum f. kanehirae]|uniref:Receptor-like serine/threonine-protein kinase ALE2 isoform X2 n=1 Tax=Cinnamomum micranthum f. kanehirae TaxID=337451 RepID=A0A3S4Q0U3_9MAGN|nr:receptor-like serine/threonine-protein kinase ALE2 isoform X2 [Cinnamomum micranthum f. kanehirae]